MKSKILLALIVAAPLAYAVSRGTSATGQDTGATATPSSNQNQSTKSAEPPATQSSAGSRRGFSTGAGSQSNPPAPSGSNYANTMRMMMMEANNPEPRDELLAQDLQFESQIRQIFEQLPAAPDDRTRADARKAVSQLLERQFTVRQQRREREIAEIEERVKVLREALKKRSDSQQQIVERRLNDLFSDAEGLGWGDVGGAGSAGIPGAAGFAPGGFGSATFGGGNRGGGAGGGNGFGGASGFAPPAGSTRPAPGASRAPASRP